MRATRRATSSPGRPGEHGVEDVPAGLLGGALRSSGQGGAQEAESRVDVAAAVLDEAVGEEDEAGTNGQAEPGGLVGQAAACPQGRGDGDVREDSGAVRMHDGGRRVPRASQGAVSGDLVVDRVQAGGAGDCRAPVVRGLVGVDAGDQLVEVGQELARWKIEGGEVVHGGAQTAHGGGGMDAVTDHVADDQSDSGTGESDDVEPVAAHLGVGGQVAVGDLEGVLPGQVAGQQAALQGFGHGVLTGVAAGIVDADCGLDGHLLGQSQIVRLEGLGPLRAPEARDPQDDSPCGQRHDDEGVESVVEDLPRALGVLRLPPRRGAEVRLEDASPSGQALHLRG